VTRAVLQERRQEFVERSSKVRAEMERLSRLAIQLQGAIAAYDELLATDDEPEYELVEVTSGAAH